jgi:superfamily II DNA or RNA helicase
MKIKTYDDDHGLVIADHKYLTDLKHNLPGRRRVLLDGLKFELSLANVRYLRENYPGAEWESTDPVALLEKQEAIKNEMLARKKVKDVPPEALAFRFKTAPYEHQKRAFYLCKDAPEYALLMEMGCGKTWVLINKIAYAFAAGRIDLALVAAPNGVHRQFLKEQLPLHFPDHVDYAALEYRAPSRQTKAWRKDFNDLMNAPPGVLKIIAINIEAFSSERGYAFGSRVLRSGRALFAVDESIRIKTPGARRTSNVLRLSKLAKERVIMSGAPITQGVEDLYSQFKFLNPDILGFSSYWSFRNYYCIEKPIPGAHAAAKKIIGYRRVDEIQEAIEAYSFRVTKDECLDLPDKVYMTREVELTPEQRKAYNELRDELVTQLENGEIVSAPIAAVKLMKLQQVLCGFLIPEVGADPVELKSNRGEVLLDVLNEVSGKVIVWCRFKHDIRKVTSLCERAGIGCVQYYGETSSDARVEAIRRFKTDDDCRVFISNPASAGTGLNLAEANTAIYYSNDFNADSRWQSEDRIHRIGQTNHCLYVDIVTPGTIDAKIVDALRHKKTVADSVLDVRELIEAL